MNTEELLELTQEQTKAWKKIKAGVKAFEKAGGKFYVCLDIMNVYNGEYVSHIEANMDGDILADECGMPCITNSGFCSYADYRAGVFINDKGRKLVEGGE